MSTQAWMGIGAIAFAVGLLFGAIWRGLSIEKVSIFGIELKLPNPIITPPRWQAGIPALLFLVAGVAALAVGSYLTLFPSNPLQVVTVTSTPSPNVGGQTESQGSIKHADVSFFNKTSQTIDIYWVNFNGIEERQTSIAPQTSSVHETYVGHLWVARTKEGVELLKYVVKDK